MKFVYSFPGHYTNLSKISLLNNTRCVRLREITCFLNVVNMNNLYKVIQFFNYHEDQKYSLIVIYYSSTFDVITSYEFF